MNDTHKLPVSVTVITLNEEENLPRLLESVKWANEVVVVDCGSKDGTQKIAENFGAKFHSNEWKGYGQQKNHAQSLAKNDWVLNLDADEACSDELKKEILELVTSGSLKSGETFGYSVPRKTFYLGRWIMHGGWYPNYLVRFSNRHHSKWTEPRIHEALEVNGKTGKLKSDIHHYTFTGIEDQVAANLRYAKLGSSELIRKGGKASLLKMLIKPVGKFLETYFWKMGFLDGWAGFLISVNAAYSMFLRYAFLYEHEHLSHRQ